MQSTTGSSGRMFGDCSPKEYLRHGDLIFSISSVLGWTVFPKGGRVPVTGSLGPVIEKTANLGVVSWANMAKISFKWLFVGLALIREEKRSSLQALAAKAAAEGTGSNLEKERLQA